MLQTDFTKEMRTITGYEEVMEVLKSRSFVVVRGDEPEASREFLRGTIGALDGQPHFERRRIQSKVLTNEAFTYLEQQALAPMIDATFDGVRASGQQADGTYHADLQDMMLELLYRVGARVTGIDEVEDPERIALFNRLVDDVTAAANIEWSAADHDEVVAKGRTALVELREKYVAPSVEARAKLVERHQAGELELADLPRDIVTYMLLNWNEEWDDELLIREVAVYLNASTRTTARITPHIVHHVDEYMTKNPDQRHRLTDESFIRRAAAEALRLHTIAPAFLRRATEPVTLRSGIEVAEGEVLLLDYRSANRDPAFFGEDAEEFNPDRADVMPSETFPWGISFGGGAHMCIGRRMVTGSDFMKGSAEGQAQGTLAAILKRLYEAGITIDRTRQSRLRDDTYYDEYASFPVIFTNL